MMSRTVTDVVSWIDVLREDKEIHNEISTWGKRVTRGVPSSTTTFTATTREMLLPSGTVQRLKPSRSTWFASVITTISRAAQVRIAKGRNS